MINFADREPEEDHERHEHIDYHVIRDSEEENPQEQSQAGIAVYALIKYISLILITLAVLYFIAVYVLPLVRDLLR